MNTTKKITNELSTTGLVICPVCNRPPSWIEGGRVHTSPMVRIVMANLNALIHHCCLSQLYTDINGQIRILRRKMLILKFVPACWKFLSGCAHLISLICRRGLKDGLAQFNQDQLRRKDVGQFFKRTKK